MQNKGSSVLDIFKICVGPSEVFTHGPWRAAQRFLQSLEKRNEIQFVTGLKILLYGPLAKNYKACRTEEALLLGLSGYSPLSFDPGRIDTKIEGIRKNSRLFLHGMFDTPFDPDTDIICLENETLSFHQNALTFLATVIDGQIAETYYITDHGSAMREDDTIETTAVTLPFPVHDAGDLVRHCETTHKKVCEFVFENEKAVMPLSMIRITAKKIWTVMQECIYRGCTTENSGNSNNRKAPELARALLDGRAFTDHESWIAAIRQGGNSFSYTLDWIGCFALAVSEENASMGKVVAGPTNRVAGIAAAVLQYYRVFYHCDRDTDVLRFLLTAGQVGGLFKNSDSDYTVATAMAAAGLAELLGGSVRQVLRAAELAVEQTHESDFPIGAVKAIMFAQIAKNGFPV